MTRALAKIHIAKKEMGLDDAAYRLLLERVTGKSSSADMTEPESEAVLVEMRRLGWKPAGGTRRPQSQKAYVRLMFALAKNIAAKGYWRLPYREALRRFVKEKTGIDNPEWLSFEEAGPVIEALKAIERRVRR